ncbi:MAG: cell division protein FtsZ [Tannerella sp.]|jgi:cell division protein FtsZ|nr:cell division protein FtsZ [Tannerella sp.]
MEDNTILTFDYPKVTQKIIKVVGVGGGGGNAVTHMYKEGIHDVTFVLCNTDSQALGRSDVPVKVVLGRTITQGLGAGNKPEVAKRAAEESEEEIRSMLSDGTRMVFITAGMGGGTGTGAAPVIAKIAKDMDILTVGIVTIPFIFEGEPKIIQALNGVEEMSKNVDALLVVNNERLSDVFHDFTLSNAFGKANDTLTVAAKSIAEIITLPGIINLDFADVQTTMKDGGIALMSNGYGEGEDRLEQAIKEALKSPLLNNNYITNAKKLLFNIASSTEDELRMDEINSITDFKNGFIRNDIEVIWGTAIDNTLGPKVKFTVLATGFGLDDIPDMKEKHDSESGGCMLPINKNLIYKYYGGSKGKIRLSATNAIVILTAGELDDDNIIRLLEENPAYCRKPHLITDARKKTVTVESGRGAYNVPSPGTTSRPKIKLK